MRRNAGTAYEKHGAFTGVKRSRAYHHHGWRCQAAPVEAADGRETEDQGKEGEQQGWQRSSVPSRDTVS